MSTKDSIDLDYEAYLADKHSRRKTDSKTIHEVIMKATGQELVDLKRLILGEVNEVYDVELDNGKNVILRISHHEWASFGKEKWAMEHSKAEGVPIPEVLFVEDFYRDGKFRSVCVLEKLKGSSLMLQIKVGNIDRSELRNILNEAGKYLSMIHRVKTTGFGSIDANGKGEYNSWSEYVLHRTYNSDKYFEIAEVRDIERGQIKRNLDILSRHRKFFDEIKVWLLHGDFGFEHIFVGGTEITGIIDFGNGKSGDPVLDLAWWDFFHRDDKQPLEWIKEGYLDKGTLDKDFGLRMNLYKLVLSLDLLDYYHEGNFGEGVEVAKSNLIEGLQYFK